MSWFINMWNGGNIYPLWWFVCFLAKKTPNNGSILGNTLNVNSEPSWLGMGEEGLLGVVQGILDFMLYNPNFWCLRRCQYINVVGIRLLLISRYKLLPEADKSHGLFPENGPHKSLGRFFFNWCRVDLEHISSGVQHRDSIFIIDTPVKVITK